MFTVKKYIIGLLIGAIAFSGIALVDEVIVKISMASASSLAFTIVGSFYSAGIITSKAEGGEARLALFVILLSFFLYVFTQIAKGVVWLFSFSIWIYIAILLSATILLILVMLYRDKKAKELYIKSKKGNNDFVTLEYKNTEMNSNLEVQSTEKLRTIREILLSENNQTYIKAYNNDPHSPGLEYVKVYKSALNHSRIKGYIKMDNAAAFWGDVYFSEDKRWIKID